MLVSHNFVGILHETILKFLLIAVAEVMLGKVIHHEKVLISNKFVIFLFLFCIGAVTHVFLEFRIQVKMELL